MIHNDRRVEMSGFIDRVRDILRGGGPGHGHDHVGEQAHGAAHESSAAHEHGAEEAPAGDDNRAEKYEASKHEGHKHC